MSVQRGVAQLLMGGVLVAGMVATGAAPALAEGDVVRVRSASTYTAGGSPGLVSVEATRRTDGCVLVRTSLALRLAGLTAHQVRVQVNMTGQWWSVPVSDTGTGVTARAPGGKALCKDQSLIVRYRLTFDATAPAGSLAVLGEVVTATGRSIGHGAAAARVVRDRAAAASPSAAVTRKPTPTPEPTPSEAEVERVGPDRVPPTQDADPKAAVPAATSGSGGFGLGWLVMLFGAAMVAIGGTLLVVLLRRSREERGDPATPGDGDATVIMPRLPG